jgi:hypothetical protein
MGSEKHEGAESMFLIFSPYHSLGQTWDKRVLSDREMDGGKVHHMAS